MGEAVCAEVRRQKKGLTIEVVCSEVREGDIERFLNLVDMYRPDLARQLLECQRRYG